jgi:hypothetical protein
VAGEGRLLDSDDPLEDRSIDIDGVVTPYLGALTIALGITVLLLLLLVAVVLRRVRRIDARLRGLTRGEDGDLEGVLGAHLEKVYTLGREVERLGGRTTALEAAGPHALQRVGLIRFNPFEDTGGNQSFAVALLDGDGNGLVLSSLHARTGTRVYAKSVRGGRAEAALSEEETAALRQATA